jgi:recombination protein RecA
MAKAKAETVAADSFTDQIFAEVEKDYGAGVMISGEEATKTVPQVIPWSPSLDIILGGGGIEEGSWIGITGHEKTSKTCSSLCFAANAQRPENGSRPIFYAKIEGRLSLLHLRGIRGLDLSPGKFNIIQSREGRILSAQDFLRILESVIKSVPGAVVILDSISALCDEREQNDGVGTETRGGGAKIFSQWCRLMNQVVPVNRTIVIGITHLISNTSGMGKQYLERAARMWLYQKDYDLRTISKTPWKVDEKQIGLQVKWVCNTSKSGAPGKTVDAWLRFGIGLDKIYEVMNFATCANLIKKAGAWFSLSYLANGKWDFLFADWKEKSGKDIPPQFQGAEKVYAALVANPKWSAALEAEVMAIAGNLAGEEA